MHASKWTATFLFKLKKIICHIISQSRAQLVAKSDCEIGNHLELLGRWSEGLLKHQVSLAITF